MIDKLKELSILSLFVAVVGGVLASVLAMVLGTVTGMTGFPTIIGGIVAVVLLMVVAAKTGVDKMGFFALAMLLVMVSVVGTIIVTVLPAASDWILTASAPLTWNSLAWSLVYVGVGMLGKEMTGL